MGSSKLEILNYSYKFSLTNFESQQIQNQQSLNHHFHLAADWLALNLDELFYFNLVQYKRLEFEVNI